MGISNSEDGAHNDPSLMPNDHREAYNNIHDILTKVATQVDINLFFPYISQEGFDNFFNTKKRKREEKDLRKARQGVERRRKKGKREEENERKWRKEEKRESRIKIDIAEQSERTQHESMQEQPT
ncbi:hypothetical protein Fmac_011113 [Flemingia macrophylla]|uniref:Uncharacterized protein n=1 Tax=Flemingia macrophylla TaxID=520843 RepID=A0ABD1MLI5_9FABA